MWQGPGGNLKKFFMYMYVVNVIINNVLVIYNEGCNSTCLHLLPKLS